jgi:hypothetical protein
LMTTNTISTFMNDVVFEEKEHNYAVESIIWPLWSENATVTRVANLNIRRYDIPVRGEGSKVKVEKSALNPDGHKSKTSVIEVQHPRHIPLKHHINFR